MTTFPDSRSSSHKLFFYDECYSSSAILRTAGARVAAAAGCYDEAKELFRQRCYADSIARLHDIVRRNPRHVDAHKLLGDAHMHLWMHENAVENFRDAVRGDEHDAETLLSLGDALVAARRYDEAHGVFERVIHLACQKIKQCDESDRQFASVKQHSRAWREHEQAMQMRGLCADAYNSMGDALLGLRQYCDAETCYRRAIANAPDYPYAYHNLAILLQRQHRYNDARAFCYEARQRYEATMGEANKNKWLGHFLYYGSLLHEFFGELDRAERIYSVGLNLDPHNTRILLALVNLYEERLGDETQPEESRRIARQQSDAAERELKRKLDYARRSKFRDTDVMLALGILYLRRDPVSRMETHARAKELLERCVANDEACDTGVTRTAKPHGNLGVLFYRNEDYMNAVARFTRALEIEPNDLTLKSNLAEAYFKLNRMEEARGLYEEALREAKDHVESLVGLADLYTALADAGDADMYDEAILHLNEAIRLTNLRLGSKRLTRRELADVHYLRGYARIKAFENAKRQNDLSPLYAARDDFRLAVRYNPLKQLSQVALRKIRKRLPGGRGAGAAARFGSWFVFACASCVFAVALLGVGISVAQHLNLPRIEAWLKPPPAASDAARESSANVRSGVEFTSPEANIAEYTALLFGSLIMMVASLYLPQVLKLKVVGMELEKSTVEQVSTSGAVGISKGLSLSRL